MNSKHNFLLITLFATTFLSAQINRRYNVDPVNSNSSYTITSYGITEDEFNQAEGSPFLDKEFKPGTIVSGEEVSKAYLRYNIFFEEIEIAQDPGSKDISSLKKEVGTKAIFDNKVFTYLLLDTGNNQNGVYFQILSTGSYLLLDTGNNQNGVYFQILSTGSQFDLYMKSNVRYIAPYYGSTSIDKDRPGKFEVSNKFFLVSKNYKFITIPKNHRNLLKLVSHKKKEVKDFLKKNRIKLDKEEDVLKFVDYYNRILKI